MLAGSVVLNGWQNIWVHHVALGNANGGAIEIPQFDYNQTLSWGSVEFGPDQIESIGQVRQHDTSAAEFVDVRALDSYEFDRIDVMKIDVEGMELAVLDGAYATIQRCRPAILAEHLKTGREPLQARLEKFGYRCQDIGMDFLCTPT
jgi:FkbM family methyltransferase